MAEDLPNVFQITSAVVIVIVVVFFLIIACSIVRQICYRPSMGAPAVLRGSFGSFGYSCSDQGIVVGPVVVGGASPPPYTMPPVAPPAAPVVTY
ncbi:hypothetical protein BV898_06299 [Hypsibius exemplaris]|uniref:Uncharacterized protein n=1 Tax=Hypsibius exemplaris TaxID=2072580 RepID=A0A1W0WX34_HYPEX|nr:hypothetical protein BV898_06299 [Hypsibius exemplaris]